ncbi:type II toxin-antitoxin system HicB family antitoxin [Citreimonas sp.]|uniref:type II toxin-antitoxin system HicB family antitoxin n=1 Tax=Citreimonas sp. TaxID=3036715 RepID=UPI0040597863
MTIERGEIIVHIVTHADTGLFVAMSDDLKGLFAHGRTIEELEANTVSAIKALLEAQGEADVRVVVERPEKPTKFREHSFHVRAMPAVAA